MELLIDVINQKLRLATNLKHLVEGTKNFIKLTFNLSDDWNELNIFAQFIQDERYYNVDLDNNNSVYVPSGITEGICKIVLHGTNESVVATTDYLKLTIDKNVLVTEQTTPPALTGGYHLMPVSPVVFETGDINAANVYSDVDLSPVQQPGGV